MQELTEIVQLLQPHYKMRELNELFQLVPYYEPVLDTLGNLAQFYKEHQFETFLGIVSVGGLIVVGYIAKDVYNHHKKSKDIISNNR